MLEVEYRQRLTDAYIAEHLWFAVNVLHASVGRDLGTPRYTEWIGSYDGKSDMRTAEEIKADILRKLQQ